MNDSDLLQRYVANRCETAFNDLVQRHLGLVYSAALRQLAGDADLARDVAQSVFIDLANKASSLSSRTCLSGSLYTSTRFAAAKVVRTETRRRAREQEAFMDSTLSETPQEPSADNLLPLLDSAMHDLDEDDRHAVLLRYFQNRPFAQVGVEMGLTEESARKRVN